MKLAFSSTGRNCCKRNLVVGANRYRKKRPADFEAQREIYYQALKQPMDAELSSPLYNRK